MSVNSKLQDLSISHQVDLQQLTANVVRRIISTLNKADADLSTQLMLALERMPPATAFSVERLDAALQAVRDLNRQAYAAVGLELDKELRGLAAYETGFQTQLLASTVPPAVPFTVASVAPTQAYAAALSRPFQGRLLSEWTTSLEADRAARIRDSIRMGFIEGKTTAEMVRQVRGTRAGKFQDGIMQIDRRNAEAMVRTAVAHTAGVARDMVLGENNDLIKAVVWSATLDLRTTSACQVRDNLQYDPVTHAPIDHKVPWLGGPGRLHWRCRSSSYPVTKSWEEMGIAIDELPAGTRASMDGQVPKDLSYGGWLKRQSAERQDQVVGPTRGKLMREGKMPFDALYTNRGEYLSLEELQRRDAKAFKRANLA